MLESNLAAAEATLDALSAVSGRPESPAAVTLPQKPSEALQLQLDALSSRYGPAYPDVKRLQAELAAQRAVEAGRTVERPQRGTGLRTAAQTGDLAHEQLSSLKTQIAIAGREVVFRPVYRSNPKASRALVPIGCFASKRSISASDHVL